MGGTHKMIDVAGGFLVLCLFSWAFGEAPPETCGEMERWLKDSYLNKRYTQMMLGILQEEKLTSVVHAVKMFDVLKTRDSCKKLSMGAAAVFQDHVSDPSEMFVSACISCSALKQA